MNEQKPWRVLEGRAVHATMGQRGLCWQETSVRARLAASTAEGRAPEAVMPNFKCQLDWAKRCPGNL